MRRGFDSHYVLVTEKPEDLFPCLPTCPRGPDFDQIIIQDPAQILPRYVVYYSHDEKQRGQKKTTHVVWIEDQPTQHQQFLTKLTKIIGVRILLLPSIAALTDWLRRDAIKIIPEAEKSQLYIISSPSLSGNDISGIRLCQWLKHPESPWNSCPFFLFCNSLSGIHLLTNLEQGIFVSDDHAVLYEFVTSGNFLGPVPQGRRRESLKKAPTVSQSSPTLASTGLRTEKSPRKLLTLNTPRSASAVLPSSPRKMFKGYSKVDVKTPNS